MKKKALLRDLTKSNYHDADLFVKTLFFFQTFFAADPFRESRTILRKLKASGTLLHDRCLLGNIDAVTMIGWLLDFI